MSFLSGFVVGGIAGIALALVFNVRSYEKGFEDGKEQSDGSKKD